MALLLTACEDVPDSADSPSKFDADGVVDAWNGITSRDELENVSTDDVSQTISEKKTEEDTTVKQTEAETTTKYAEPDTTTSDSRLVWISATGSKYHSKNDCGNMNPKKARQMTEEEAQEQGYEPCKKCY